MNNFVAVTWEVQYNSSVIPFRQVTRICTKDGSNDTTKDFTAIDLEPNLWVRAKPKSGARQVRWARVIFCGTKGDAVEAMKNVGPRDNCNSLPPPSPAASTSNMLNFSFNSGSAASCVANLDPEDDDSSGPEYDRADLDLARTVRNALRAADDLPGESTHSGPCAPVRHTPTENSPAHSINTRLDTIITSQQQILQNQDLLLKKIAALEKVDPLSSPESNSLEIDETPHRGVDITGPHPIASTFPTASAVSNDVQHHNTNAEFVINTSATINNRTTNHRPVDFQELLHQARVARNETVSSSGEGVSSDAVYSGNIDVIRHDSPPMHTTNPIAANPPPCASNGINSYGEPSAPVSLPPPLPRSPQPVPDPTPQQYRPFVPNLSPADIDVIFGPARSRRNFAVRLARRLFSHDERVGHNCNGRGKPALCPDKLAYIYHLVMGMKPRLAGEPANHILWSDCIEGIDLDTRKHHKE